MAGRKPTKVAKLDAADEEVERPEGEEQEQNDEQQQALEQVITIQNELNRLNEQASEEILHVEQKYNKLRQPHFQKRSELFSKIPDFWVTTLLNNPNFSEILGEDDENVLQYLENLTVDESEMKFDELDIRSGYKICFHFKPNPFFTNSVLVKEVSLDSNGECVVRGTDIEWKPGMDITSREPQADQKDRKRPHEDPQSFFMWFSNTESPDDIGELIKDDIWPNPLHYFLSQDVSVDIDPEDPEYPEDAEYEEEEEEEEGEPDEVVELGEDDDDEDEG
ncbi:hypothetical protein EMCRGX_G020146 [Ephydatia muelleri]|eukprot:Em0016g69a